MHTQENGAKKNEKIVYINLNVAVISLFNDFM